MVVVINHLKEQTKVLKYRTQGRRRIVLVEKDVR